MTPALPSHGRMLGDGIELLQGVPQLPHSRSNCTEHNFSPEEEGQYNAATVPLQDLVNAKHCDKCYCYVCDVPASECIEWRTHCHGQ